MNLCLINDVRAGVKPAKATTGGFYPGKLEPQVGGIGGQCQRRLTQGNLTLEVSDPFTRSNPAQQVRLCACFTLARGPRWRDTLPYETHGGSGACREGGFVQRQCI
jgi:hypothetical protein